MKLPTEPGSLPVTSNFVTDLLDLLISKGHDGVYLTPNALPKFRRDFALIDVPDFDDPIDKDELYDAMESLGVKIKDRASELYIHHSDYHPETQLLLTIQVVTWDEPMVQFRNRQH